VGVDLIDTLSQITSRKQKGENGRRPFSLKKQKKYNFCRGPKEIFFLARSRKKLFSLSLDVNKVTFLLPNTVQKENNFFLTPEKGYMWIQ
jgi:hypothetical protein